ncbi:MAG: PD-(D/E)XK nuclease family protein, partial [Spirochaetota bacterium]
DKLFKSGNSERYNEIVKKSVERTFLFWEKKGMVFLEPAWAATKQKILELLRIFILNEEKEFPEHEIKAMETLFVYKDENLKAILKGKIDRISQKDGWHAIIDYKKKNRVKKKEVLGDPESALTPSSYQIPFYVYLAELNGLSVKSASYYDIENAAYTHVFHNTAPKAWADRRKMDELAVFLKGEIDSMVKNIREGNYQSPSAEQRCEACNFRTVCRRKFSL